MFSKSFSENSIDRRTESAKRFFAAKARQAKFKAPAKCVESEAAALTVRKHRDDESEIADPPADDLFIPVLNTAYCFHYSDTYSFGECSEPLIGVTDLETQTIVKWLETYAWTLFDYDESENGEDQFRGSVRDFITSLLADTISADYSIDELIRRANQEVGNSASNGKFSPPRTIDFVAGDKIHIHLADGKLCKLRIYNPSV
jgi:hypothetical protein